MPPANRADTRISHRMMPARLFSAVSTNVQGRFTLPVIRQTITAVLAYR